MAEQNEQESGVPAEDLRPDGLQNAVDGEQDVRAGGEKPPEEEKGEAGGEESKPVTEERLTAVLETLVAGIGDKKTGEGDKQPELSQEQIEQLLNVYKPTEKIITDLRAEDPKVALAAIKELVGGVVKQANTMADARIQQIIGELREKELTPLQRYYEEVAARREEEVFYRKYEDLKPYELVVNSVSEKIEQSGKKFDSKEKLFEEVARVSREALKSMGITPKAASGKSAGRASAQGGSRMAALSNGSGGRVAGGASGGNDNRKLGMAIFDGE